jgi:glycosyltransferase involved in cell wall biosynthesis
MTNLGVLALINFSDWDDPAYAQTGGINSVIKSIMPYLKADKVVLYGYTYEKENLLKEKQIGPNSVVFPVLYVSRKSLFPIRFLAFLYGWRINRYLRKHEINVVYSHTEEIGYWLTFGGMKYIHHLHTFVNVLDISGRRSAKIELFRLLWEKIRMRVIKKAYRIVAVNKDVVEMVGSLIGENRIIKLSNYVDSRQFTFRNSQDLKAALNLQNEKIALSIGRIALVKGLELFVDTVQALNQNSRTQWKGMIIGNGDYENTLKSYIRDKQLTDKIVFIESINDPVILSKYYSLADVHLITSKSESVPLTLLESLACGTPVVSTPVGIAPDVLGHNNGFVVAARDPQAFSEMVLLCSAFKAERNLLPDPFYYSVEHASSLLNKELSGQA